MYAWQFAKALYLSRLNGWTRFVSMQNHYNLLYREEEREMIGLCQSEGIAVIPWSPLARGRLTRAWQSESTKRAETDSFGNKMYSTTEEATARSSTLSGVFPSSANSTRTACACLAALEIRCHRTDRRGSKPHHLEDAVAALSVKLTAEEIAALEASYIPHPVLGFS